MVKIKMNLDFTKCKTKEDVDKVFEKHKDEFEAIDKLKNKLKQSK